MLRYILHLQVGPDHDLIYSLNLLKDVSFFIFSGSAFHMFGPSTMRPLLPYFSVLRFLTSKSKGWTLEFVLDVKTVFMNWGLVINSLKYFNCKRFNSSNFHRFLATFV